MARHLPGVVWPIRKFGTPRNIYVKTSSESTIEIWLPEQLSDTECVLHFMSRADARLLARRINQCLDDTTGRSPGQ